MSRLATVSLFACAPLLLASLPAQKAVAPTWHSDLDVARTLAAKQGAPLFVTFRCER